MPLTQKEFTRIYNDHLNAIYRFCYLKVSSRSDAEDLAQGVFLRFLEDSKKRSEEVENIRAFLYQIARNLVIDHYREKGKAPVPLEDDEREASIPVESPEKGILLHSDMREVSRALTQINQDYADLVIWRYIDDLSVPEIAKLAGKSEGAVRVGLHRAIQDLKEELNTVIK